MNKASLQNVMDMNRVISAKRKIDVDVEELKTFLSECTPTKEGGLNPYNPVLGEEGEYIWDDTKEVPNFIRILIKQVKALYDIKDDIKSNKVSIYLNSSTKCKDEHTIKRSNMNVGSRIILCVGHREVFKICVSAGGYGGSGTLLSTSCDSFQILMGLASGVDIIYNDLPFAITPAKKGFREQKLSKDPTKRYIIVIDGIADADVLINSLNKNLDKINRENINNSDVDDIVNKTTSKISAPIGKVKYDE